MRAQVSADASRQSVHDKSFNYKRVERVWRQRGLQVPQRPKKRKVKMGQAVPCQAERPNHVWTYDF